MTPTRFHSSVTRSMSSIHRPLWRWALGLVASLPLLAAEPSTVSTAQPRRGDITRYVTLPGTLRANQMVTVQARVAGFVRTIHVDRGDRVKEGQLLAEIEVPELLAERAKRLAEVKVAETDAQRLEAGRRKSPDLVTPAQLDAANGRLDVARAELEKNETLLRFANLTAPFAGVITARHVDRGAFVPAGAAGGASAVVTLADTSVLRTQVPVPEAEAVFVRPGQPVRVTVVGLTNLFTTTITRHTGLVDDTLRSLPIEADLPNLDDQLRPGMFVSASLGLERHTGALLVPTEAVASERNAQFVFRVDNGVCRKTAVKLGFQDGPATEIVAGIADGTVLISPARLAPADGAPVNAKDAR